MPIVLINENNLLQSPDIPDAHKEIEVSEAVYQKISEIPFGYDWKYDTEKNDFKLVVTETISGLTLAREAHCFSKLNKSPMWFLNLSKEKQEELTAWYNAWLDVTKTLVIPEDLDWLD